LGRSHSDAVASQIRRVVLHLLKLEFSPATQPRAGWRETVREARAEIEGRLESDPGLKPRLPEMIRRESPRATRLAAQALLDYGEHAAATSARARSHYTDEQILGSWLPGDGSAG